MPPCRETTLKASIETSSELSVFSQCDHLLLFAKTHCCQTKQCPFVPIENNKGTVLNGCCAGSTFFLAERKAPSYTEV